MSYLNDGGKVTIEEIPDGTPFRWFNPKTGEMGVEQLTESNTYTAPSEEPWVLIIGRKQELP